MSVNPRVRARDCGDKDDEETVLARLPARRHDAERVSKSG